LLSAAGLVEENLMLDVVVFPKSVAVLPFFILDAFGSDSSASLVEASEPYYPASLVEASSSDETRLGNWVQALPSPSLAAVVKIHCQWGLSPSRRYSKLDDLETWLLISLMLFRICMKF
jgi:hypothetical protein